MHTLHLVSLSWEQVKLDGSFDLYFYLLPFVWIAEMVMQLLVLLINGKHLCFTWKAEAAGKHVCHQKRCWEILCKLTFASSLLKKHLRARSINTQQIQTFQRIASSWQTEGKKYHEHRRRFDSKNPNPNSHMRIDPAKALSSVATLEIEKFAQYRENMQQIQTFQWIASSSENEWRNHEHWRQNSRAWTQTLIHHTCAQILLKP